MHNRRWKNGQARGSELNIPFPTRSYTCGATLAHPWANIQLLPQAQASTNLIHVITTHLNPETLHDVFELSETQNLNLR